MESLISKIHSPFGHEHNLGRAALLGSLNIKAAHRRRPTDIVTKFLGSPLSEIRTLCDHYPRISEFIPLQRRHVQEHRNNSNAFPNTTLKRHECRAPFTRFMEDLHPQLRTR